MNLTPSEEKLVEKMNETLDEIEAKETTTGGVMEIREDRLNLRNMVNRGHVSSIKMMASNMKRAGYTFDEGES